MVPHWTCKSKLSTSNQIKEIANIDTLESTSHKEVRSWQILKSEQDTCRVVETINNFTNPLTTEDKDALCCLSSGASVPSAWRMTF